MEEILQRRAQLLAQPPKVDEEDASQLCILEFLLGSEIYAIEVEYVKEVIAFGELTPLPGVPPHVLGVVNRRRFVVSVFDLKKILSLQESEETSSYLLVLEKDETTLSIVIDSVVGTRFVHKKMIEPPPSTFTGLSKEILLGLTEDRVILLQGSLFFTDKTFILSKEMS